MALFAGGMLPWIELRFLDGNGQPLTAGKIYTYEAGTNTPLSLFADATLLTAYANPLQLDAEGRAPGNVYLAATGYKFVVTDADDVTQYTADDVQDVGQVFASTFGLVLSTGGKDVASGYETILTDRLVTVNGGGGPDPSVITLMAAADARQPLTIKNVGTTAVSIDADGADLIDGSMAQVTLPAAASPIYPAVTLVSNGISSWFIVSSHGL